MCPFMAFGRRGFPIGIQSIHGGRKRNRWERCSARASGIRHPRAPISTGCWRTLGLGRFPPARALPRLTGQGLSRRGAPAFAFEGSGRGPRTARRGAAPPAALARPVRGRGAPAGLGPDPARRWWLQPDAGASSFREPDGDGLLGRSRTVFALTDVMHLLADELTGLARWRLALLLGSPRPLDRRVLRHRVLLPLRSYKSVRGATQMPATAKECCLLLAGGLEPVHWPERCVA